LNSTEELGAPAVAPAMRGFSDSRGFLSFFLGAAVAAACIVLLQPSALCPFDGLTPADRQELAILSNRTHAAPCSKKLHMVRTYVRGSGIFHCQLAPWISIFIFTDLFTFTDLFGYEFGSLLLPHRTTSGFWRS
jgi:hypothetical protein